MCPLKQKNIYFYKVSDKYHPSTYLILFQSDRAVSRRQLTSLDLFLESARQQLSLLMNREPEEESDMLSLVKDREPSSGSRDKHSSGS